LFFGEHDDEPDAAISALVKGVGSGLSSWLGQKNWLYDGKWSTGKTLWL